MRGNVVDCIEVNIDFSERIFMKEIGLYTVQLRCFFTAPPKPVGHKIEWGGLKFNDHR